MTALPEIVGVVYQKLIAARDPRLREICSGEPEAAVMAELLAALPGVSPTTSLRYLAPGRSGAKVLVLINPNNLPVVVKLGRASDIERERKNYAESSVEQRISQEIRPTLQLGATVGEFGALVYSWAGGWEQVQSFREFFRAASEEAIARMLMLLMNRLFRWHQPKLLPDLPFDLWQWNDATLKHVQESVKAWAGGSEIQERLLAALSTPAQWRDALLTKHGGIGTCHGDLNCNNILISDGFPKLIDFASVSSHDSPARDWSKLERDIKFRCLRNLVGHSAEFVNALVQVDAAAASETVSENCTVAIRKTATVVIAIRSQFRQLSTNLSDIPSIEYLYFLFCWTLAYLNNQEGLAERADVRNAIIESAVRTLSLLEAEINRTDGRGWQPVRDAHADIPLPQTATSESDGALRSLTSKFVSQLRIAGSIEDEHHVKHAVYLDDGLYVHRSREEDAIADFITKELASSSSTGKWLSIVGDAGHGKSSLLWYVFTELSANNRLLIIPFLAQVDNDLKLVLQTVSQIKARSDPSKTLIVLIDTLDIIVGLDDQALGALINSLKALGALIVTTSRKQEASALSRFVANDSEVEIRRYNDAEAQEAIRNQVRVYYPSQPETEQQQQIDRIWDLLEQQRDVRELDLEPLILRMVFEAYVPAGIPQDVNTQQVYREYWKQVVLYDRVVSSAEDRFNREHICRLIAHEIALGDGHSDKIPLTNAALSSFELAGVEPFQATIEKLVSSGALQWAEGWGSVRFFHQTFFEFVAAYDLLSLNREMISVRLSALLNDVANFNFFRAPILKQLAIQSFDTNQALHLRAMQGLRVTNNELAAQLALEILGKVPESEPDIEVCRRWIEEDPDVLQDVICETVRHYPKNKTAVALRLLRPFLSSPKETAIYSLCIDTLAKSDPKLVFDFLHTRLSTVINADDDDKKSYFKNALCAVAAYGEIRALNDLLTLLPRVKPGLQSSILNSIAEIITEENADAVNTIIHSASDLLAQMPGKNRNEVWDGLSNLIFALHRVAPEIARGTAQYFLDNEIWRRDVSSALFVGRIAAFTDAYQASVEDAIDQLRSSDHLVRILNSGFLSRAPLDRSEQIMNLILKLDRDAFSYIAIVRCLFTIVANLRGLKVTAILQFLERWPWPESGAGSALTQIFKNLAAADPIATKAWLLSQLRDSKAGLPIIKLVRALTILIKERPDVFERDELEEIYERSFAIDKSGRQVFAAAIGSIATVDSALAKRIFDRLFDEEGKLCQIVAVLSLEHSLQTQLEFSLSVGSRVLNTALRQRTLGLLDNYLVVLKSIPRSSSVAVLAHFDEWFTHSICAKLDAKILSEVLSILKIASEKDPLLAFRISQRIPILNKGIAGGLAALYDNVSEHSDNPELLAQVLEAFSEICGYHQLRMGNALRRSLPRLGRKLGSATVIEMVMRVYKYIDDELALRSLFRAAFEIPGWGATENAQLLRDEDLPSAIRGLLSTRTRR